MRDDQEIRSRLLRAYKMMLNFYGMELQDETTGEVGRCEDNWDRRYEHLNGYHLFCDL